MVIMAPVIIAETSNGGTSRIYSTMEVSPFLPWDNNNARRLELLLEDWMME
jgi:hypothetical protein